LKNTIDLQWKIRANYNARLCASLRKAAGARTMGNNGKNNAQNNGTVARKLPHRPVLSTPTKAIARRREAPGAHFRD
jgi:hypothetical protein